MKNLLLCVGLFVVHHIEATEKGINPAVQLLQRYVQINTSTGNDLTEAIKFWKGLAKQQKATFKTYNFIEGYPIIVIRWKGLNPLLSSIVLTSHVDVVPVADETRWKYPPFSGTISKDGFLHGRGSQDCKSVTIQYYQALKNLRQKKVRLQRDVNLVLFTDHETGVYLDGIRRFIESEEFSKMHVGGGIDEGVSYTSDKILLLYQDKALLVLQVDCYGKETHGSLMPDSDITAIGKCAKVIESLQEYRDDQVEYMKKLAINDTSGFTSINLNRLQGALTDSVLPGRITLRYYINPSTETTVSAVFHELQERIKKIGGNITLTIIRSAEKSPAVRLDNSNPYWKAISDAARSLKFSFDPTIIFDQTNAGAFRKFGVPLLGFSPLPKTKFLVHGVDETINIETFLNGILLYEKCIQNLANLSDKEVANDTREYLINFEKKKKYYN